MTNFERIKRMSIKEIAEWLNVELDKTTEPVWCKGRRCKDVNSDCLVCYTKWLDNEVEGGEANV